MRARTRHQWFIHLILVLSSTILSLLLAEALVRTFELIDITSIQEGKVRLSENPRLMYELVPSIDDHNKMGFRGAEFQIERPPGTFRVLALGDSLTYGLYLPYQDSYPAQLEKRLNHNPAQDLRFEVLNLGVPGYSIIQEAEQFNIIGRTLNPDVVVLMVCINDWEPYTVEFDMLLAKSKEQISLLSDFYDPATSKLRRIASQSHFYQLLNYHLKKMTYRETPSELDSNNLWSEKFQPSVRKYYSGNEFYSEHFHRLASLTRDRNIPLLVMLAPFAPSKNEQDNYQQRLYELEYLLYEENVPLIYFPMTATDEIESYFLKDGIHLSKKGGEAVSESLVEAIRYYAEQPEPSRTSQERP